MNVGDQLNTLVARGAGPGSEGGVDDTSESSSSEGPLPGVLAAFLRSEMPTPPSLVAARLAAAADSSNTSTVTVATRSLGHSPSSPNGLHDSDESESCESESSSGTVYDSGLSDSSGSDSDDDRVPLVILHPNVTPLPPLSADNLNEPFTASDFKELAARSAEALLDKTGKTSVAEADDLPRLRLLPNVAFDDVGSVASTRLQLGRGETIHANWVRMPTGGWYIMTQYPAQRWTMQRVFWETVNEASVSTIVNLSNSDNVRETMKSGPYWPEKGEAESIGSLEIRAEMTEKDSNTGAIIRHFNVTKTASTEGAEDHGRTVRQIHVPDWRDFGTINADRLIELIKLIDGLSEGDRTANNSSSNSGSATADHAPLVVHCRAGIGRSGVVVAAREVMHRIDQRRKAGERVLTSRQEVEDIVIKIRCERCSVAVQTLQQLDLIRQVAATYSK